jgi:hypothetical protein
MMAGHARPAPALLAALLLASPAAAEKIDLSGYLTVYPVLGDFRVYAASNGEVRREEVVRVDVLVEDSGPLTLHFVSGQVGGVAYP